MPTFSVPAGCRDAMTNLHNAHSDRFNRIVTALKTKMQDMHSKMKETNLESDKILNAYMDSHRTLHTAVNNLLDSGKRGNKQEISKDIRNLKKASLNAQDMHSSLTRGIRTKPSETIMEPTGHLERITKNIRRSNKAINPVSFGGKIPDDVFLRKQRALHAALASQIKRDREK